MTIRIGKTFFIVLGVIVLIAAGVGIGIAVSGGDDGGGDSSTTAEETDVAAEEEDGASEDGASEDEDSGLTDLSSVTVQSVADCLRDAGAFITDENSPIGQGARAVFAQMPNGSQVGVAVGGNPAIVNQVAQQFSRNPNFTVSTGERTMVLFKGSVDDEDREQVEDCVT